MNKQDITCDHEAKSLPVASNPIISCNHLIKLFQTNKIDAFMPTKIKFNTTIFQDGNNTGIEVPETVVEKLSAGKRPAVNVSLNGFSYRSTIAVMGGKFLIPLSAERRNLAHVKGGDKMEIALELDTEPREIVLPDDFTKALNKDKTALKFFEGLSYSAKQRYILPIGQAKTEETRQRRIEKAVSDLNAGKK
jgi:hypothetical protein